jgi:hypothetical protein
MAGNIVATAAYRGRKIVVAGEIDRVHDVNGALTTHDKPRSAVDHCVPDRASGIKSIFVFGKHLAAQTRTEPVNGSGEIGRVVFVNGCGTHGFNPHFLELSRCSIYLTSSPYRSGVTVKNGAYWTEREGERRRIWPSVRNP